MSQSECLKDKSSAAQQLFVLTNSCSSSYSLWGAPNENIVQNHLNIALLNVFLYLNGRYRQIFIP